MTLFHVTTLKLINKYLASGQINNPVRAWKSLDGALRFSKQTGRPIIIRLNGSHFRPLGGHQDQAMIRDIPYPLSETDLNDG